MSSVARALAAVCLAISMAAAEEPRRGPSWDFSHGDWVLVLDDASRKYPPPGVRAKNP